MNLFEHVIDDMPRLLEKLNNEPMVKKQDISTGRVPVPSRGVYVFFDGEKPIYVGQSDKIRQRLSGHCNQSSGHYSATFAFRLAIKEYESLYQKSTKGIRRKVLENDQDFSGLFRKTRGSVAEMGIKIVKIDDSITQTIFEVYAAMKLDTLEFNSFKNH